MGVGSTTLGCFFGIIIGLSSGYLGGWVDLAAQRLSDMLQALPLLVMALVMAAALGPSLKNTIIAISIPLIPSVARVIRASTLALREQPFVESAKAIGMRRDAHRAPPHPAEHIGAADRARHRPARRRDPDRGVALLPRARHSRAASLLGPHAVGIGGRVYPHRALARLLPGAGDQPRRLRHQPAGDAIRDLLDPRQRS